MNRASQQQNEYEIPCEFCGASIKNKFFNSHLKTCSKDPIYQDSNQASIPCEVCEDNIPFDKYPQHLKSHTKRSNQQQSNNRRQNRQGPTSNTRNQRNNTNTTSNRNNRTRQQRQFDSRAMDIEDPCVTTNREIESVFQSGPFGDAPSSRIMITMNGRPIFSQIDTFESSTINPGRSQFMMFERDPFEEIIGIFTDPRQEFRIFGGANEQVNMNPPPLQGFKKKELDRNFFTAKYDKEKSKGLQEENKQCLICLTEFESGEQLRFLECCHRFHKKCIDHWMKEKTTCPICKKDFKDFQAN